MGFPSPTLGRFHVYSFLSVLFPILKDPDVWTHLVPAALFALLLSFQTCPLHLPKMGDNGKAKHQPHCVILAACLNVGRFEELLGGGSGCRFSQPPWGPACRWHLLIGFLFTQSPSLPGVLRVWGRPWSSRPGTALRGEPRTATAHSAKNR